MHEEPGHGNSIAAWTGVCLLLLATVLLSVGVMFGLAWANWSGVAVAVIGIGAWWGLNAAGYNEEHWENR